LAVHRRHRHPEILLYAREHRSPGWDEEWSSESNFYSLDDDDDDEEGDNEEGDNDDDVDDASDDA
jgi:hypothetical protein